ncbi:chorismate transformation enzyme, FkbO/Hyg5 family [Salinisphaera aquimarina]|uniref:Pteridine-dependent deoxygenase n=1 Tax=Salinisphaera aquimarina TaxID=2094031 RepID=A0ABV7EMS9_9GAMM
MSDDRTHRPPRLRWRAGIRDGPALAHIRHDSAPDADIFACPLRWLAGDFDAETWQLDGDLTQGTHHGWHYRRSGDLVFAARHVDDGDGPDPQAVQQIAHDAYRQLFALQGELGLRHVQRIWHWLSSVTAGAGDDQRYQRFCRGRAQALDTPGQPMTTLPPATLVDSARRGVRLHVLLGERAIEAVENPRQISAYDYPRAYGVRAPAFARAGIVTLADTPYLLISGTASIVGHASRHIGDVAAQSDEALTNVAAVIEAAAHRIGPRRLTELECIKAYLRHPEDAPVVHAVLRRRLPGVAVALLHAPLCRDDLLVEFEAQMRLL